VCKVSVAERRHHEQLDGPLLVFPQSRLDLVQQFLKVILEIHIILLLIFNFASCNLMNSVIQFCSVGGGGMSEWGEEGTMGCWISKNGPTSMKRSGLSFSAILHSLFNGL